MARVGDLTESLRQAEQRAQTAGEQQQAAGQRIVVLGVVLDRTALHERIGEALPTPADLTPETVVAFRDTLEVRAVRVDLGAIPGAYTQGNGIKGTGQLLIDPGRLVVVGATFVGPGVQELLHSATVAIAGEVPLDRLRHAVPSFPTVSEAWLNLLEAYDR